jgi:hypothetical protein
MDLVHRLSAEAALKKKKEGRREKSKERKERRRREKQVKECAKVARTDSQSH